MNPIFLGMVATGVAASKRAHRQRRTAARKHHVGFFAWVRRWVRRRRSQGGT